MNQKNNMSDNDASPDDGLESRVDEMMAVERDYRHPANKAKRLNDIVVEKPNLPMNKDHLEIRIIHPDEPKADDDNVFLPQDSLASAVEAVDVNNDNVSTASDASLIDTPETDQAVDHVLRQEKNDAAVAAVAADEKTQQLSAPTEEKHDGSKTMLRSLRQWFSMPRHWIYIALFLFSVSVVLLAVPALRHSSLNALGVRTTASLSVVDNSTDMPLRNVEVVLGGQSRATDENGQVEFDDLQLGKQEVRIVRRAFADRSAMVVLGVRDNALGEYWLFPTGVQYQFMIRDFVADVPIAGVEVIHDDVSAFSGSDGAAVLTVDVAVDETEIIAEVVAEGYRREQATLPVDKDDSTTVILVPELKHVYVRPPPGQPDIMAAYLDGEDETILLEATGLERRDITIVPHPSDNRVAIFTTQDDARSEDDFLLTTLTVTDINSDKSSIVAQSERLQPVGWYGDNFVYVKARSGVTGMDTRRHQLISYDYSSDRGSLLATSNYFNTILPTEQYIYYAPSSIFLEEPTTLRRVLPDGSSDEAVTSQEAWSAYRHDFRTFVFATNSQWFEYDTSTGDVVERAEAADTITSRLYLQNPSRDDWYVTSQIDEENGRKILLYDDSNVSYTTLVQGDSVRHPVRWLHESVIVYRMEVDGRFFDYAHHIDSEEPKELWSVGSSSGLERWYSF